MSETIINEVTYYPIKPTDKGLIGFSSCLLDEKIALSSISVYLTPSGSIRVLFPNKYLPNGKEVSLYYPINKEVYESIRQAVANKVEAVRENVRRNENDKQRKKVSQW